nr:response regulator [uncultured Psychroserpens sp.]
MSKHINVLIVEDEPLIIGLLETMLNQISENNGLLDFNVRSVMNCDSACNEIKRSISNEAFDLVFLDINIPASTDKKLLCGEDVGIELKNLFPNVKIVVLTSHSNNYRLNSILKSLNPEGFIVKAEIDFEKLKNAIIGIINEEPYYSKTILQLLRRHLLNDFVLDRTDRQLLYQISKGAKMKNLLKKIPLSKSAIEYRKRHLKEVFDVENGDDLDLITKAEECGYI